jgi:hypothetical protein
MTSFVNLTLSDFLRFIQGLLPRGPAWTRDDDAVLTQVAQAIADGTFGHHQATLYLSEVEADPRSTLELLPDFENDYGLPDPCTPLNPTVGQRRAPSSGSIRSASGRLASAIRCTGRAGSSRGECMRRRQRSGRSASDSLPLASRCGTGATPNWNASSAASLRPRPSSNSPTEADLAPH